MVEGGDHKNPEKMDCKRYTSHAQAEVWNFTFGFLKSMSLKCALDLGIPDAINNNGQPMSLSQLHCALSLAPSKKSQLRRLMRFLTRFGFFVEKSTATCTKPVYDLTDQSRMLTRKDESTNLLSFIHWQLSNIVVQPSLYMGDWFMQEEKKLPFELAHGCNFWDLASQNPTVNKIFNDAMASGSGLFNDVIVSHGGDIFKGVASLVDVGGGKGAVAELIAENFPHVKCSVLDLPHVVGDIPNDGLVKFVSGDMFNYIPPADVVLLKWLLHDWSDIDCIKILRRCKDAIPSKEAGGKVLVLEAIVASTSSVTSAEPQLLLDMMMLTITEGAERDENEWAKLFTEAGFSSYKIIYSYGFMSIMEVYP